MSRGLATAMIAALLVTGAFAQTAPKKPAVTGAAPIAGNTMKLLNQRIPEVSFDQVPFETVMDWVKEITGANINVRWETLIAAGVEKEKPITIKVKNLRLSQVLWMIMNEAGGPDLKLAYRASGSLLILSTEVDLSKEMIVKVYDVSDLLTTARNFYNEARMDPAQAMNQQNSGSGGGGSNTQLFQSNQQGNNQEQQQNMTGDIERLAKLITDTVEPDSWAVNGGGLGNIYPYHNLLVVYNSLLVHQRIGGYLEEGSIGTTP